MRKQVYLRQRTPEWYLWRKGKIGASSIGKIISTPFTAWEEVINEKEKPITFAMQKGIDFEDVAREAANKHYGTDFQEACFEHVYKPYIIASLDGWCDGIGGLEVKVSEGKNFDMAKSGILPEIWKPQLNQQMLVTNVKDWFFSCHNPSTHESAHLHIKRDDYLCEVIERAAEEFKRRVDELDPPEPSEEEYMRFADRESIVPRYRELVELEKRAKKEKEALRDRILAATGNRNAYLGDLRITKSFDKGRIDYDKIEVLSTINLDLYRKAPIEKYRLS